MLKVKPKNVIIVFLAIIIVYAIYYYGYQKTLVGEYQSENGDIISAYKIGNTIFSSRYHVQLYHNNRRIIRFTITADHGAAFSPPIGNWETNDELILRFPGDEDVLLFYIKLGTGKPTIRWYLEGSAYRPSDGWYNIQAETKNVIVDEDAMRPFEGAKDIYS